MIYLVVLLLLLLLSFRYDINGKTEGRDLWYGVVLILFILIAGLRWRLGVDTPGYIETFYHKTFAIYNLTYDDLSIGKKPLWVLLNSLVFSLGGRFYIIQIIQATFVNVSIFLYFKKHCNYIFTCVLFYYISAYIGLNMEAMKAAMSIAVVLYANDFLLEKKWVKAYLLYFVAILFHPQSLLLLLMPLFLLLRFDKKGLFAIVLTFIIGYTIQSFLGIYLDVIEAIGDDAIISKSHAYTSNTQYINGNPSLIGKLVREYSYFIYLLLCMMYLKWKCPHDKLMKLEPFIMVGMLCIVMQMNVRIFYRYSQTFCVYRILLYAYVFVKIATNSRNLSYPLRFCKSLFIHFLPLIICMLLPYTKNNTIVRYLPYNSVINCKIDKEREKFYHEWERCRANFKEY